MIRITAHRDPAWILTAHARSRQNTGSSFTGVPARSRRMEINSLRAQNKTIPKQLNEAQTVLPVKSHRRMSDSIRCAVEVCCVLSWSESSSSVPVSHYIQLILFPQTHCGQTENTTWILMIRDSGGNPIQILLARRVYNDPNCASVSSKKCQSNHTNLHSHLKIEQSSII